jgi:hypothetical protein
MYHPVSDLDYVCKLRFQKPFRIVILHTEGRDRIGQSIDERAALLQAGDYSV